MTTLLFLIAGTIIGFLINILRGNYWAAKTDAKIYDLTKMIELKRTREAEAKADADKAIKEYTDALKKYDPDFHSDDDTGGHNA